MDRLSWLRLTSYRWDRHVFLLNLLKNFGYGLKEGGRNHEQKALSTRRNNRTINADLAALAADRVNLGIFEIDLKTRHVLWSDAMYRLIGVPHGQPVSQSK